MNILIQLALLVLGFVMLIKGADFFVEGSSKIADKFGIPQLVIGLTIVAMGTSAPEAAVSISSALRGSADIAVGNVLGSNILNILVILGVTSVIHTTAVQASSIKYEIPFVIVITVILAGLGYFSGSLRFSDGLILWALFIIYLGYLLRMAKSGQGEIEEGEAATAEDKLWKLLIMVVLGGVLIVWGADVAVDAASELARIFGMSERLIGLTIVALGTSLPELMASTTAALKGKCDIAVGNIIGSNIFNILFVLGTTALITPVPYQANFGIDSLIAIGAAVLLWLCAFRKKELNRASGLIMLICYGAYLFYLLY